MRCILKRFKLNKSHFISLILIKNSSLYFWIAIILSVRFRFINLIVITKTLKAILVNLNIAQAVF